MVSQNTKSFVSQTFAGKILRVACALWASSFLFVLGCSDDDGKKDTDPFEKQFNQLCEHTIECLTENGSNEYYLSYLDAEGSRTGEWKNMEECRAVYQKIVSAEHFDDCKAKFNDFFKALSNLTCADYKNGTGSDDVTNANDQLRKCVSPFWTW